MKGQLKWFNKLKGFGFIAGDDGKDYFVHHTQFSKDLKGVEEELVEFEPKDTDKGLQALNVVKGFEDSEEF